MTTTPENEKSTPLEPYGFSYLLKLAYRLRYWMLGCVAVFGLAVFIMLRFIPRQYERTVILKVDMSAYDRMSDSLMDVQGVKQEFVRDRMESRVMLLQSQPVVQAAMKLLVAQNGNTHAESIELYSHNKPNLTAQYSKYSDVVRLSFKSADTVQADVFLLCLVDSYNEIVSLREEFDHAYITVIDPPQGSDKPVYPHPKALYLLAVILGVLVPLTCGELKIWWKNNNFN